MRSSAKGSAGDAGYARSKESCFFRGGIDLDPDGTRSLALHRKLDQELANGSSNGSLQISRSEARIVAGALVAKQLLLGRERLLLRLIDDDVAALRAIRSQTGDDRLREAARIKGWIAQKGERRTATYPRHLVLRTYVALTTGQGTVWVGDEFADLYGPDIGNTFQVEAPVEHEEAIEIICDLFEWHSKRGCRQWIREHQVEIEARRAERRAEQAQE